MKIVTKIVLIALVAVFTCVQSYALEKITSENYEDYGFTSENYTEYLDYYAIANVDDLYSFQKIAYSEKYVLTSDIVINKNLLDKNGMLSGSPENFIVWNPKFSFDGVFDGNNHTISGLYVETETSMYTGFIGCLQGSNERMVKNVTIEDSYFKSSYLDESHLGAICGYAENATILNCHVNATIIGMGKVGGLVGYARGTLLSNCSKNGKIECSGSYVGGIVGSTGLDVEIVDCSNKGSVSAMLYVGGICGSTCMSITNCFNIGKIEGQGYVGGIVGYLDVCTSDEGLTNCHNTGECISDGQYVGGLIGYLRSIHYRNTFVTKCYNKGKITGKDNVGGIVGFAGEYNNWELTEVNNSGVIKGENNIAGICGSCDGGTIANAYNVGDVNASGDFAGGIYGKYRTEFHIGELYVQYCYNAGRLFVNSKNTDGSTENQTHFGAIGGVKSSPVIPLACYYDSDVCHIAAIGNANITGAAEPLTTAELCNESSLPTNFSPSIWNVGNLTVKDGEIISEDGEFGYSKDGEYPSLKNVGTPHSVRLEYYNFNYGTDEDADWKTYTPLYVWSDFLKLQDDIDAGESANKRYVLMADIDCRWYVGSDVIFGSYQAYGSSSKPFEGIFLGRNKTVSGFKIESTSGTQGMFGYIKNATIKDLVVKDAKLVPTEGVIYQVNYMGAICGQADNSIITNCVNYANIECDGGLYSVGGICGTAINSSTITRCFNYGNILASKGRTMGGISGSIETESSIEQCYNAGTISGQSVIGGIVGVNYYGSVSECYNTGIVEANDQYVGGIVGESWSPVTNSLNRGAISCPTTKGYVGGIAGWDRSCEVEYCLSVGSVSGIAHAGAVIGDSQHWTKNYYDSSVCNIGAKNFNDSDIEYGLSTSDMCSNTIIPDIMGTDYWGYKPMVIENMKKYKYYPYLKCFGEDSAKLGIVLNCYPVTLDFNGGTTEEDYESYYVETEEYLLPEDVSKDGCTFLGWYSNPNYTSLEYTEIPTTETGIKSYYAKWIANTYDVVLDADGGTIDIGNISSYTYGYGAILPTAVTKNGYTFKGWYPFNPYTISIESYPSESKMQVIRLLRELNPSLALSQAKAMSELPWPIVVESDLYFMYPKMETFISEMRKLGAEISVTGGVAKAVTLCDVVLVSMDPNSKIEIIKLVRSNLGISLSEAKTVVENLPATIATNIDYEEAIALINDLYAKSSANIARCENVQYESQVTAISITDFGTKSFRAQWEPKTYSVRLEVNGGTNTKTITEYTFGNSVVLPTETEITRNGYTFDGWYVNSNYDGDALDEISDSDYGDKVLYAKWSANMYEINLDANEGTINSGRINTYTFGDVVVLPIDVTRDGYDFKGWFAVPQDDADGQDYEPIIQISASDIGDKDLYAWWTPKKYTITLHTSGGTIPEGAVSEYSFGTTTQLPETVELDGYTFKGWYANSYFDGPTITEIESTDFGNKQFWARWSVNCQIEANAEITNASCYGLSNGAIEVTATNVIEPVTYQWVGMESTAAKIETLPAGNYSVVITDYRECTTTKTFTVSQPAEIIASIDTVENPRCDKGSRIILKSEGDYTYLWSNGSTEKDLIGAGIGNYEVTVTEPATGCSITLSQSLEMSIKQPEIALVTVSKETGNNLIVWVRENTDQIDYYTIYRETSDGNVFDSIATVNYSELSVYEDEEADAADRQWSYKISATDYCGNETALSVQHTTLHLQPMPSLRDNTAELRWDSYYGIEYSSFYIIRETKVDDYTFIDTLTTIPSTLNSYSAELPSVGKSIFYVGIKLDKVISPFEFLKAESGPFSIALSNIAEAENKETFVNNVNQSNVEVYAVGHTINVINAEGKSITIYDNTSRKIAHTSSSLTTIKNDYEVHLKGVYYVIVDNESFAVVVK